MSVLRIWWFHFIFGMNIRVTPQWARWCLKSPALPLFTQLFIQAQIKKTSEFRVTGLCAGNSPVTGEFPAQRASNAENVSVWWRHHDNQWLTANDVTMCRTPWKVKVTQVVQRFLSCPLFPLVAKGCHSYYISRSTCWMFYQYNVVHVGLTHCGLLTPYRVIDLGQHWFSQWFVAHLPPPTHYRNQCWLIVGWTISEILITNQFDNHAFGLDVSNLPPFVQASVS